MFCVLLLFYVFVYVFFFFFTQKTASELRISDWSSDVCSSDLAFMATVFGLALFGLVAPIWCFRRWRGGWRIAAAIPMVGMVLFVAFLLLTAVFNPDSLGLLPLVVLMAAVPCSVAIVVLFVARKLTGADRREAA